MFFENKNFNIFNLSVSFPRNISVYAGEFTNAFAAKTVAFSTFSGAEGLKADIYNAEVGEIRLSELILSFINQ